MPMYRETSEVSPVLALVGLLRFDSAPRTQTIRDRRGYPNLKGLPPWILQLFAARKAASKPPSGSKAR